MITKQHTLVSLALAMSLILSACGLEQIPEPTAKPTITATVVNTRTPIVTATPIAPTRKPISTATPIAPMYFNLETMTSIGTACIAHSDAQLAFIQFNPGARFEAVSDIISQCYGKDKFSSIISEFGWQTGLWASNPDSNTSILMFIRSDSPGGDGYEFMFVPDEIKNYQDSHVYPPPEMTQLSPNLMPTSEMTQLSPNLVPTPVEGAMYYEWMKPMGLAVYAGNVVLCSNDYICPKEKVGTNYGESFDLGRWDPSNPNSQFVFAGQTDAAIDKINDVTIMFPAGITYQDVVILSNKVAIDFIAGILPDGRQVPFSYTYDDNGALVPASNFMETATGGLHYPADQGHLINGRININLEPCGIVGFKPDSSYAIIEDGGFLFRMPTAPVSSLGNNLDLWGTRGKNAFQLSGIRIVYISMYNVPQEKICP